MNNYTEVIFLRTSHATSSISKITQNLAPIIFRNFFWKFTKLILFQRFLFICCKRQFSVCCSQNGNEMINSFFLKQIRCNLFDKILTIFFWNQQHLFKYQKDLIFGALSVSCVNSVLLFSGQERASVFVIAVDHDIISYIDAFFLTTAHENLYYKEKRQMCLAIWKSR